MSNNADEFWNFLGSWFPDADLEGTSDDQHAEWRQFKDRFPNATTDDVIAFMNRLQSDPRFQ